MHGGIDLKSELGQGTTTTFWIPFNKPQSTKLGSPLIDARSVPETFRSDSTIPGCLSATQSVNGDFPQKAPSWSRSISRAGTGFKAASSDESPNEEPVPQEVDREKIHVLVVEDKYVSIILHVLSIFHEPDC